MGFKLKKKNTGESGAAHSSNAFLTKIQTQVEDFARLFGDSSKSKPFIYGAALSLILSVILLLFLFYSVPRHNELTRSLGELRLLSQTISRQATEATASGTPESIKTLSQSQARFAENLETVQDIHGSTDAEVRQVEQTWNAVSRNIDQITSQQKIINKLYDTNIAISETIPGIQAEYNLLVDQMARQNMSSSQVVIAKNQVFIAERILRSISSVLVGNDSSRESADDFNADTETFGTYLNAQLNGSSELGVERINDPALRESLTNIQDEYNAVLKSAAATVLNNSNQIVQVRQASAQIFSQSDELLAALNKLTESASSNWAEVALAILLLASIAALIFSVIKLLALRGGDG